MMSVKNIIVGNPRSDHDPITLHSVVRVIEACTHSAVGYQRWGHMEITNKEKIITHNYIFNVLWRSVIDLSDNTLNEVANLLDNW